MEFFWISLLQMGNGKSFIIDIIPLYFSVKFLCKRESAKNPNNANLLPRDIGKKTQNIVAQNIIYENENNIRKVNEDLQIVTIPFKSFKDFDSVDWSNMKELRFKI